MNDRIEEGRCLCGAVRFRTTGDPVWIGHCHCQSCRRNTGSAVATFVGFRPGSVQWTAGSRAIYESSPGVRRGFCQRCGTPLTYEADRFPDEVHLYVGGFDHPERLEPQFHVFYAERIPWLAIDDDTPRHPGTTKG